MSCSWNLKGGLSVSGGQIVQVRPSIAERVPAMAGGGVGLSVVSYCLFLGSTMLQTQGVAHKHGEWSAQHNTARSRSSISVDVRRQRARYHDTSTSTAKGEQREKERKKERKKESNGLFPSNSPP